MAISSGTKLGSYEITGPIGAGGMGEVYRARDTKLDRNVAIKVLPEELSREIFDTLIRFLQVLAVACLGDTITYALGLDRAVALYEQTGSTNEKLESRQDWTRKALRGHSVTRRLQGPGHAARP